MSEQVEPRWLTELKQERQRKAARQGYTASAHEEAVAKVVDAAPPLTPEQRDLLALLLRG